MKRLFLATILVLFSTGAWAQEEDASPAARCGSLAAIATQLKTKYGETVSASGKSGGVLMTLFTSKNGKTWTLIAVKKVTGEGGKSMVIGCFLGAGQDWRGQ